jgi:YHS domain-containing protein
MRAFTFVLIILSLTIRGFSQGDDLRKKHFNIKGNIALDGFDPVSYFDGKPQEGKSQFKFNYRGVDYQFTSQSNLNKFKTDPSKYEPAYGGWCAYAMGENGEKVKVDPETFTILEGRLYLFYNFWGNNTLTDWKKDERKLKEAGDRNWNSFLNVPK